jgi:hypothetical protein
MLRQFSRSCSGTFLKCAVFPAALLTLFAASALAQPSPNTLPAWNGAGFISSFGVPNTATYGQTVAVSAGMSPLRSFAFEIGNCGANVSFRGHVYAWDGSKATGSSLFDSPVMSVPAGPSFQAVTFDTGDLALAPGTYVLFASTSQDQAGAPMSACRWGAIPNDNTYRGGHFVFLNNGTNPPAWTTDAWSSIYEDLAFRVDGLAGPAPTVGVPAASTTSLLIGFVSLIGVALFEVFRRRRLIRDSR